MDIAIAQWIITGLAGAVAFLFGVYAKLQSDVRAQIEKASAELVAELRNQLAQERADNKALSDNYVSLQKEFREHLQTLARREEAVRKRGVATPAERD